MYLPTRPLELASPLACLSVAELSRRRGFCADQAASTHDARLLHLPLRLGIAGHTDVLGDFVVIRHDVLVGDRPIERAAMFALDLEVVRQEPREVGKVVQRRAADAPARLVDVAEGILAFEQERTARGF